MNESDHTGRSDNQDQEQGSQDRENPRAALAAILADTRRTVSAVLEHTERRIAESVPARQAADKIRELLVAELDFSYALYRVVRVDGRGRDRLTARERQVAVLAAEGKYNSRIARELELAHSTVSAHLRSVYRKLAIRGRSELARLFAPLERVEPRVPEASVDPVSAVPPVARN